MYQGSGSRRENEELRLLLRQVQEKHLHPEDAYEIAALLEADGWNDVRAGQRFGVENVFDLARTLWRLQRQSVGNRANEYAVRTRVWEMVIEALRQFSRGMVFALPMLLSEVSMLSLHFSLWSYQNLSVQMATAIAIGTILSFLTVGGFMQAIARRAFFYIFQGYYKMAQRVTFNYIRMGIYTSIGVSLLLFWTNALFPILPYGMLAYAIAFYIVLNAIWLSVTVMYVLKKEIFFTALLAGGISLVWIGFRVLHLNIILAQLIAMLTISVVGILLVLYFFRTSPNRLERGIQPQLPRPGVTVYSTLPYFFYGFLYFLLLFADRVMAWSTNSGYFQYLIWFRGDYEVGLDFALATMILPLGVSEVVVTRIMNKAVFAQRQYYARETSEMNRNFLQSYKHSFYWMVITSATSAVFVYLAVKWLLDNYLLSLPQAVTITSTSNFVFIIGLVSYAVLSVALLNAVTMFSLSRPELVIRPILISVAFNLLTGFLLSRWFGYADAVWGSLVGSIIFAVLTTRNILGVFRNFDYHMYLLT